MFSNSADEYLKVHHRGRTEAGVTVWGDTSGYAYTFTPQPNGTTDIDVVVVREGKNLKGWVLGFVLRTIGRPVLETAFEDSVEAIEAREYGVRAAKIA